MNILTASKSKSVLVSSVLGLVLAACSPSAPAAAPTATPAPAVLEYGGSGVTTVTYSASLKAGVARVRVTAQGSLTVDIDGPNGFSSQVLHAGTETETMNEVQIPADGSYQITIDYAGKGSWKVVIDMTGTASAPPAAAPATAEISAATQAAAAPADTQAAVPTNTQEPVLPTDTPASVLEFHGSGISVYRYHAALPAGIARFHVTSAAPLTVDITGPGSFSYQVKHVGDAEQTLTEVQIPAAGVYDLAIDHAGSGNWSLTIETSETASIVPDATATQQPTAAAPGGPLTFKGSGTSVYVYEAVLRAGNARFQVTTNGVLTVDITGPNGFYFQVKHTGISNQTVTNVNIPADGTYELGIDHVGNGNWTVTITQ
jgi:hypothetical protein